MEPKIPKNWCVYSGRVSHREPVKSVDEGIDQIKDDLIEKIIFHLREYDITQLRILLGEAEKAYHERQSAALEVIKTFANEKRD